MKSRAILSGRKHGVNLQPGSSNPGRGDCAFESVIQNNNDRNCYKEKFPLSIDYYRRMWATDMANRTVDTDWNIYSRQEWLNGWQQMMIPGTYERGIFGDLMLPGIACGIRKILLIFNTNPESAHDPIYVVDPRQFNVQADTSVPIILAYNQSHYESLHPCSNKDILASINLVKEYLEGRYRFGKKDFPFLLHLDDEGSSEPQVQGACAPLLKTNLKEDDHKPGNVKEMVAPSPKKIAKLDQTSQHKKNHQQQNLKRGANQQQQIFPNQRRHSTRTKNSRVQRVQTEDSQLNHNLIQKCRHRMRMAILLMMIKRRKKKSILINQIPT